MPKRTTPPRTVAKRSASKRTAAGKGRPAVTRSRAIDPAQARQHVRGLLQWIGEDPDREGLKETPERVIRAMGEHFAGYAIDPGAYLRKTFEDVGGYD